MKPDQRDARIDSYIQRAAPFAQPILEHLRELVHFAYPEIEETLKWSHPHFVHRGTVCSMAAFKNHCVFGFWKHSLLFKDQPPQEANASAMGQFGRLTNLADLPKDAVIIRYVKEAVRLNQAGTKLPPKPRSSVAKEPSVPEDLATELKRSDRALAAFKKFSPSHRKEYIEWITEAKRKETRQKRLVQALEWIADGKPRHWKYLNC